MKELDKKLAEDIVASINRNGLHAQGKKDILNHLKGLRLTRGLAIKAKCYDCMGFYSDGVLDCETPECPLYGYNPYAK